MDVRAKYDEKPWLRFYPQAVPHTVDVPEKSLSDVFDEITERYSNRTAIVFYGNEISFKQLRQQVDRLATALCELGIEKEDKVALYLLNSPQYVIAYFAVLKVGATVTPIAQFTPAWR